MKSSIGYCSICKDKTEYLCADCAINYGKYIRVCIKPECRDKHEEVYEIHQDKK